MKMSTALVGAGVGLAGLYMLRRLRFGANLPLALREWGYQVGAGFRELFRPEVDPNMPSPVIQSPEVTRRLQGVSESRRNELERQTRVPGERERIALYPWLKPGEPWRPRHSGEARAGQPSPY